MITQTSAAIRTTAAALAVFATMVTLNSVVSIAEPQRGESQAKGHAHHTVVLAHAATVGANP
jgi:hypothetical protein